MVWSVSNELRILFPISVINLHLVVPLCGANSVATGKNKPNNILSTLPRKKSLEFKISFDY